MKSSVVASLEFDFRGKHFKPSLVIDLDAIMQKQGDLNGLHDLLAASIGLDSYTYEYDVLILQDIVFSEPTGLVCQFIHDGRLNFDGFIDRWETHRSLTIVRSIAEKYLSGAPEISQYRDNIERALIESYKAGQKNRIR